MKSSPPKVFISATSGDLRNVRNTIKEALLSMECLPVVQEHFAPNYRDVAGMLREKIGKCDAVIHVAGMRYGAEPNLDSLPDGTPRRSYTQMELDLARELKLEKIFTFICPEDFPYESKDKNGDPLEPEPEELRRLQLAHRERLLSQKELYYKVRNPEDIAVQVREIQLELEQIKGQVRKSNGRILAIGSLIALGLAALAGGILWLKKDTGEVKAQQEELQEQIELQRQVPRVILAYQDRFRDIRNGPGNGAPLTNTLIDKMVRAELPDIVGLDPEKVNAILEVEAPKLAANQDTAINLKLASLFVMGDYEATLEQGEKLLVDPTVAGLRTMGDAALAKFDQTPEKKLREDAIRYYRGSQALIEKEREPSKWAWGAIYLANVLRDVGQLEEAESLFTQAMKTAVRAEEGLPTLAAVNNLADLLRSRGRYREAEQLLRDALKAAKRLLGDEHLFTLTTLNSLAVLLNAVGKPEEAGPLYREVVETGTRVQGRDHPKTLNAINNLGSYLSVQGNYAEAESLIREVLSARERTLGPNHPDTLRATINLAQILGKVGNPSEAEKLIRRVVGDSGRILGSEHPFTLSCLGVLASALTDSGQLDEAERLTREVLEKRRRILGEHPDTLAAENNLAVLLDMRGKYAEAEPLHRQVLASNQRLRGPEHPDTLTATSNLAAVLKAKASYSEAETLNRSVLEKREKTLGREHPDTLGSMSNLGLMLHEIGRYEAAAPLLRECLETRERLLGQNHPDTLSSMNNLALLLGDSGRPEEAESLHRVVLDKRAQLLGRDHPDTLVSILNLSILLRKTGVQEDAGPLLQEALDSCTRVLGRKHPHTLVAMTEFATLLQSQEKDGEAGLLFRETFDVRRQIFGPIHPQTLDSLSSLAVSLFRQGKFDETVPLVREAVKGHLQIHGENHKTVDHGLNVLRASLLKSGKNEIESFSTITEFLQEIAPPDSRLVAIYENYLGVLLFKAGQNAEAMHHFHNALKHKPTEPEDIANARGTKTNLAAALRNLGQIEEARTILKSVIEDLDATDPPLFSLTARARYHLALCEMREKNWGDALIWLQESIEQYDLIAKPDEAITAFRKQSLQAYRDVLVGQGTAPDEIDRILHEFD